MLILKIFAMTSSSPYQFSYMCFGEFMNETQEHLLGCEFDLNWMQDAETVDLRKMTEQPQFLKVRDETRESRVHEYGDLSLGHTKASEVLGFREQLLPAYQRGCKDKLSVYQVPVKMLKSRIRAAKDPEEKKRYENELLVLLQTREELREFFSDLKTEVVMTAENIDFNQDAVLEKAELTKDNIACYENAVTHFNDHCFKLGDDPFVGTLIHILINLCNIVPETQLVETIKLKCQEKPIRRVN